MARLDGQSAAQPSETAEWRGAGRSPGRPGRAPHSGSAGPGGCQFQTMSDATASACWTLSGKSWPQPATVNPLSG